MSQPRLFLLCGLPFAGKTTLAQQLVARYGWRYIALDAINTERGVGLNGQPIVPSEWDATYQEAYRRVAESLRVGQTVIYDETNFLKAQRDHLRTIGTTAHARVFVVFVPTPEAMVRQRWQQNRITPQRNDVRDEDFLNVLEHFEPPTADEIVIHFDPALPLDRWLKETFESHQMR